MGPRKRIPDTARGIFCRKLRVSSSRTWCSRPNWRATLAAARRRLHEENVDLVLLDMNLPDGNGLALARELAAGGDIPAGRLRPMVIAVTASVLPQDRAAAIEAGCDGFLDKPYAAADLVAVVAEHLPTPA